MSFGKWRQFSLGLNVLKKNTSDKSAYLRSANDAGIVNPAYNFEYFI